MRLLTHENVNKVGNNFSRDKFNSYLSIERKKLTQNTNRKLKIKNRTTSFFDSLLIKKMTFLWNSYILHSKIESVSFKSAFFRHLLPPLQTPIYYMQA